MDDPTTMGSGPGEPMPDRWELTGVPAEPPVGTAVRDRHGQVWVRGAHGRWARPGVLTLQGGTPWVEILLGYGPLVRLVPADDDARGAR